LGQAQYVTDGSDRLSEANKQSEPLEQALVCKEGVDAKHCGRTMECQAHRVANRWRPTEIFVKRLAERQAVLSGPWGGSGRTVGRRLIWQHG